MVLTETPLCEFGRLAPDFSLIGVDDKEWNRDSVKGEHGLLVMFICNHCPYVQGIRKQLIEDVEFLSSKGIGCVAIMSNDTRAYPDDSFENMKVVAKEFKYPFPYLFDEDQSVAKAYDAKCTPDFFGYNSNLELQYRGRLDSRLYKDSVSGAERELRDAMVLIAETGQGPKQQTPSMGCSIKWK